MTWGAMIRRLLAEALETNFLIVSDQVHVQCQGLKFFHENVEALGKTWHHHVLAFDDGLVHTGPAQHVIRLHSQELLQSIRCTVSFHCPHFHLTQTLTTELRFPAEWLLGNQR